MSDLNDVPDLATSGDSRATAEKDLSARSRFFISFGGLIFLAWLMYYWNIQMAENFSLHDVQQKHNIKTEPPNVAGPTNPPGGIAPNTPSPAGDTVVESDGSCNTLCEKREEGRKTKFGGDLLDSKDILRLAKEGREKTIKKLREDYGEYFDSIFIEGGDKDGKPTSYRGLTALGSQSRERLKNKLKLKVLRMMSNVNASESSVMGCNCMKKQGKANGSPDDSANNVPNFYEKYVFANGGHSQAAGHGNTFKETYTAYFAEDVRPIMEAIGIDLIDRNYAAGGMKATPFVSTCSKEIFGREVDFLVWNYAMTDSKYADIAYYLYRGAINAGRPAMLIVDGDKQATYVGVQLEKMGLTLFKSKVLDLKGVPDSAPDGIPLSLAEMEKFPDLVKYLKVKGGMAGAKDDKWSCTPEKQAAGSDCLCPNVGGRSSWHMGYRPHALQGRLISLPFIDILIEAISEIAESTTDTTSLLKDVEAEEDRVLKEFLKSPVIDFQSKREKMELTFGPLQKDENLLDTWFKGPSMCRTSLSPAESRFLGLTTNTDKVGQIARCGEETYDTGVSIRRFRDKIDYEYVTDVTPIPGEFNIIAPIDFRKCYDKEECPEIVMPDYTDWFWGVWKDGKTSVTFPNEKEKEYYNYDPKNFQGILGLVPTQNYESKTKAMGVADIRIREFQAHIKTTVNGKAVTNYRLFNEMAILEGDGGSVYWEPSANSDYVIEFEGDEFATAKHLRLYGFVLY